MNNKEFIGKSYELYQKAKKRKRSCFLSNCNQKAIKSHIIQKKGILNSIAKDSFLYELNIHKYFDADLKFQKKGIGDVMTFDGFCNPHDTMLFKEIELEHTDFSVYKNQLLLTYRAIANECRKKEIIVEWYESLVQLCKENITLTENELNTANDEQIEEYLIKKERIFFLEQLIVNNKLGINDLMFYFNEIEVDIKKPSNRFMFFFKTIPYFEVVASSTFHLDSYDTMHKDHLEKPNWEAEPLNSLFFHILPQRSRSIVIFGFHNKFVKQNLYYFAKLAEMNETQMLKEISDILIERIESWSCSEEFHKSYIEKDEAYILEVFQDSLNNKDFHNEDKNAFSIFEKMK